MLNFSLDPSGIDFKCPYLNRPLKPLTLKSAFRNICLVVHRIAEIPLSIQSVHEFCN
jgi:hypothetical protein